MYLFVLPHYITKSNSYVDHTKFAVSDLTFFFLSGRVCCKYYPLHHCGENIQPLYIYLFIFWYSRRFVELNEKQISVFFGFFLLQVKKLEIIK